MKCPKCGYLGFEAVDRCRNCGHDFTTAAAVLPELELRGSLRHPGDTPDLDLGAPPRAATVERAVPGHTPEMRQPAREVPHASELPLFGAGPPADGESLPLMPKVLAPRPPLAVRRATLELPRVRQEPRSPLLDLAGAEPVVRPAVLPVSVPGPSPARPARHAVLLDRADSADLQARALAASLDLLVLCAIDAIVVYFTLQICGLTFDQLSLLPKAPLATFLLIQNGAYLTAFTAGGQTLGKMAMGIRVVAADDAVPVDLGRSFLRTVGWAILAAPAGLGFLTAVLSPDRRGLHDRWAGTRVVRAVG